MYLSTHMDFTLDFGHSWSAQHDMALYGKIREALAYKLRKLTIANITFTRYTVDTAHSGKYHAIATYCHTIST